MKKLTINDPVVIKYMYGEPTLEEIGQVIKATIDDPELNEKITSMMRADAFAEYHSEDSDYLPMTRMAAADAENLCDFQCEMFILKKLGIEVDEASLKDSAKENAWLSDDGTPLHSIGRLLEQHKLSVTRQYNANGEDIKQAIAENKHVIVVVNKEILYGKENTDEMPNHAIVVLSYDQSATGNVSIYDSDSGSDLPVVVEKSNFDAAWETSAHHLVIASGNSSAGTYVPHPIDTSDIELDPTLYELQEAIAENAHEVWAVGRQSEGWTYGPERNDKLKQTPDMLPYSELTEKEKDYDRSMASETLKLVKKLGYLVEKKDSGYRCPCCNTIVRMHYLYCPTCGEKIPTSVFMGSTQ